MSLKIDKNCPMVSSLDVSTENSLKNPSILIKLEFDSPEELIGYLIRAHLKTGKKLTRLELNLMLIARRELTPEQHQKTIYNDALLLLANSTNC